MLLTLELEQNIGERGPKAQHPGRGPGSSPGEQSCSTGRCVGRPHLPPHSPGPDSPLPRLRHPPGEAAAAIFPHPAEQPPAAPSRRHPLSAPRPSEEPPEPNPVPGQRQPPHKRQPLTKPARPRPTPPEGTRAPPTPPLSPAPPPPRLALPRQLGAAFGFPPANRLRAISGLSAGLAQWEGGGGRDASSSPRQRAGGPFRVCARRNRGGGG